MQYPGDSLQDCAVGSGGKKTAVCRGAMESTANVIALHFLIASERLRQLTQDDPTESSRTTRVGKGLTEKNKDEVKRGAVQNSSQKSHGVGFDLGKDGMVPSASPCHEICERWR